MMSRKPLLPCRGPSPPAQLLLPIRRLLLLPRRRSSPPPSPDRRRPPAMAGAGQPVAPAAAAAAAPVSATSFRVGMVRVVSFLVGGLNCAVMLLGLYLMDAVLPPGCGGGLAVAAAPVMAGVRVLAMLGTAWAQHATADAIARRHLDEEAASVAEDAVARHEIRAPCT
ncbi:uncharacterized protein [Lolium perenne]|uniref:uncharacterized protein isoform X2 n=1 Tax=Lolium perenne TaxID=4522 RepID=UPI0021F54A62|nr:uncharacterized protein LOC127335347 isoform X2 [Lolium perenne]XP_051217949.1 uncharacterized protein LOC127335347 isoform X2 [Lolium perenne]